MGNRLLDRIDNSVLYPIQEGLAYVQESNPAATLGITAGHPSKTVEFLQKALNALGPQVLGSEFKPLEVNGKADEALIKTMQEFILVKRGDSMDFSVPSYEGLKGVAKPGDINAFHVSAVLDTLLDRDIMHKDKLDLKPELYAAITEINQSKTNFSLEALGNEIVRNGGTAPLKVSDVEDVLRMHEAAVGPHRAAAAKPS